MARFTRQNTRRHDISRYDACCRLCYLHPGSKQLCLSLDESNNPDDKDLADRGIIPQVRLREQDD